MPSNSQGIGYHDTSDHREAGGISQDYDNNGTLQYAPSQREGDMHTMPANDPSQLHQDQLKVVHEGHYQARQGQANLEMTPSTNRHTLTVGSRVQVPATDGTAKYGVIRWIGFVKQVWQEVIAGIEMVSSIQHSRTLTIVLSAG